MMTKILWITTCIMPIFLLLHPVVFSQGAYPDHKEVQLTAKDGLKLIGDYFAPIGSSDEGAFAVLFIHQHGGSRGDVAFLARPIVDQGFALLSVDLRGHGDTGAGENWEVVTEDLQGWMEWLQSQPGVRSNGGLMTVGVAVGGNYALTACANAAECRTAVAISPLAAGCEVVSCVEEMSSTNIKTIAYIDATTTTAISVGLKRRSAFLIFSQESLTSDSSKYLLASSSGNIQANIFAGAQLGMDFFGIGRDEVPNLVTEWLMEHN